MAISKTARIEYFTFLLKFERYRLDDWSIFDAKFFRASDEARTTEVTGLLRIVAPRPLYWTSQLTLSFSWCLERDTSTLLLDNILAKWLCISCDISSDGQPRFAHLHLVLPQYLTKKF